MARRKENTENRSVVAPFGARLLVIEIDENLK